MNFKIEINYISISNYPFLEEHFEKRAREGWLISKIFAANLFLYRKISPEELDFSISPYELETFFTRKTRADLEEFQTVCKYVGWNYAAKTSDLHIYYKKEGDEARPLETDEEERFRSLENLAKKYRKNFFVLAIYIAFMSWWIIGGIFSNTHAMQDGLQQSLILMMPIAFLLTIYSLIDLNSFIKRNRKNLEEGYPLEFKNSNSFIFTSLYRLFYLNFLVFIFTAVYLALVLRNKIYLISLFPVSIGLIIGSLYRFIIKPWRKGKITKLAIYILGFIVTLSITSTFTFYTVHALINRDHLPNTDGLRVLSVRDFLDNVARENGDLSENASFLIPKSYEYNSYGDIGYVRTEYSKALNESLAKRLVKRYIRQAENSITGQVGYEAEYYFENNIYNSYFGSFGISEDDFYKIDKDDPKKAEKEAIEIARKKSILPANKDLWSVDEAYFLSFAKKIIVLRKGREVLYLVEEELSQNDLGFLDREIITIVKDKLGL